MPGMLSIVATPIGNLEDLSPRAARTLAAADLVACEDTRVTRRLLTRLGARPALVSYRAANERAMAADLVRRLAEGARIALVTDAGTPGVSDPGNVLVTAALERGIPVEVIPGPSAVVAALALAGLPTARFVFEGFLPATTSARTRRLRALASEERTIVLFEAPHRIERTVAALLDALGDRKVAMAREMTKLHEEVVRTSLSHLLERLRASPPKGEITLVVEGAAPAPPPQRDPEELAAMVRRRMDAGAGRREAIDAVSEETGIPRRRVYQAEIDYRK